MQRAKLIKQIKAPNNDPNDGDICLSLLAVDEGEDEEEEKFKFNF